jgi:hypothetical protein
MKKGILPLPELFSRASLDLFSLFSGFLVVLFLWGIVPAQDGLFAKDPPIRPWAENNWYWSYHGKPVILMGGSDDDNLFQWRKEDLIPQLDRIAAAGGNVARNTMSDRKDKGFEVSTYRLLKNGKYDLNQWNKEYWKRFERLLRESRKRGIIVQIEVWDRFDYSDIRGLKHWERSPYNPKNNINYTYEASGFAERYPEHPGANKQPFFFTTPRQRNNKVVLPYQQAYVNKLLKISLKYDNVLYCMDNETSGDEEWARYWATYIKQKAAEKGREVYVTEMWDDWNLRGAQHRRTFDHPGTYDFVDVSQNTHLSGDKNWNNFLYVRQYLVPHPRPINTTKIYGSDKGHYGTAQEAVERFWCHLLAGGASVRFHRPPTGLGIDDQAAACLQAARKAGSLAPFQTLHPANELLGDRQEEEVYLAADPGRAYMVYFPKGGEVTLDLSAMPGKLKVYWINIDSGAWDVIGGLDGGGKRVLRPPSRGNRVAVILADPGR